MDRKQEPLASLRERLTRYMEERAMRKTPERYEILRVAGLANGIFTIEGLMKYIKGPDFPTAATILGTQDIKQAYETGRGSIKMKGVSHFEELQGGGGRQSRTAIIIDEIPYQLEIRTVVKVKELH